MIRTVIDLTSDQPPVTDERRDYQINWSTTLLVSRAGDQTIVVTSGGEVLQVARRLPALLNALATRFPLTSDAGWFAAQHLYQEQHRTTTRMTRSYVNGPRALVAYAGASSSQAGYYMRHFLEEVIDRPHGLELVFQGGVRVLTTATPRTQQRLAIEADEIAYLQQLILGHIGQNQLTDPATRRTAARLTKRYLEYAFEQLYRVRERKMLDSPDGLEWL